MDFKVIVPPDTDKALKKLPLSVQERIIAKFLLLPSNPFRYLESFQGSCYKMRIGEYRALIDADFEQKLLVVRIIDKRERVYR